MTVVEFLRILRANWIVLIVATLVGAGCGLGYAMLQPRVYTSTSTGFVVVGDAADQGMGSVIAGSTAAQDGAKAYLPILGSRAVAQRMSEMSALGITEGEVAGALSGSVAAGSSLIVVSASSGSPEKAQEMATLALKATAEVVADIEQNSSIRVVPLEDAGLPGAPSSPNYRNLTLIGAFAGFVLGFILAFLRRALDVRVRTTKDLEQLTSKGLLGIVPKTDDLKDERRGSEGSESQAAEAIRQLRTNLRFVSIDNPPRSFMVTSPNPQEGKSTVSSALARSMARAGQPTLIIDADLRRPTQAKVFGIDGTVGLTQVLSGQASLDTAPHRIGDSQLYVLPAGRIPPNPSELLGSARMAKLIAEASQHFTVIIDAPPLLPVTDASLLSTVVDGTILVSTLGKTHKEHVEFAVKMLEQVSGKLLGSVLNQVPTSGVGSTYYGFGYGGYRRGYGGYYGSKNRYGAESKASRRGSGGRRADAEVVPDGGPAGTGAGTGTRGAGAQDAVGGTPSPFAAPGAPDASGAVGVGGEQAVAASSRRARREG